MTPRCVFALAAGAAALGCAGFAGHPSPVLAPPVTASDGIAHRVSLFTTADGLELFAQSWAAEAVPPRAVLVVMHGLKDHGSRYGELAVLLAHQGFEVRAFDLRGHGDSQGDRVYVHRFEQYVADLDRFLRQTEAERPGLPLFLLGHSMGGAIVVNELLARHPPIAGAVLSGAALKLDVSGFTEGSTKALAFVLPRLAVLSLPDQDFSQDPQIVAALAADPLVEHGKGPAATAAALLHGVDRIQDQMAKVDVPLLILHGSRDKLTMPEGSRQLYARAVSADKTLQIYDGDFHDLLHEPNHAQVEADILAWLTARVPPPKP